MVDYFIAWDVLGCVGRGIEMRKAKSNKALYFCPMVASLNYTVIQFYNHPVKRKRLTATLCKGGEESA